jgi:hypothetical protein
MIGTNNTYISSVHAETHRKKRKKIHVRLNKRRVSNHVDKFRNNILSGHTLAFFFLVTLHILLHFYSILYYFVNNLNQMTTTMTLLSFSEFSRYILQHSLLYNCTWFFFSSFYYFLNVWKKYLYFASLLSRQAKVRRTSYEYKNKISRSN